MVNGGVWEWLAPTNKEKLKKKKFIRKMLT